MNAANRWAAVLMAGLMPALAAATGTGESGTEYCNPVGTWSVNVAFPEQSGIPPFTELLSLLPGGVVIETNTQLHPNSANQYLPFNGSPGHGAWARRVNCRVKIKVLKQVFDPTHQFQGFVRISVLARIKGNTFTNDFKDSNVELIFGPDPNGPPAMVFGGSTSVGTRITAY